MTQWYPFTTGPQEETKSADILRERGFECIVLMVPNYKRAHRRHRVASVAHGVAPAMRSYLFLEMGAGDAWRRFHEAPVNMRPMMTTIRAGKEWQRVPRKLRPHEVEYITHPSRGMFFDTDVPADFLKPESAVANYEAGDVVKLFGGGFDGWVGTVVSIKGGKADVFIPDGKLTSRVTVPVGSAVRAA